MAAAGGVWSGGAGVYTPNDSSLNATYIPTTSEIQSGSLNLYLTTTGNGTCPPDIDTVEVDFVSFDAIISVTPTDVSCFGGSDGVLEINLLGGISPYVFLWDNGETTASISGLFAGTYFSTITNGNGCDTILSISVGEPIELTVSLVGQTDVICNGESSGTANISVVGGTSSYSYLWANGEIVEDAFNLADGVQTVTVTDANSCQVVQLVTISEPLPLQLTVTNVNSSCGSSNGILNSTVSGGTLPYNYIWSTNATTATISGLTVGIYTVTVEDQNACKSMAYGFISDPVPITALVDSSYITCNGGSNGMAHVTANSGTTPYVFQWSNGQTDSVSVNMTSGMYSVTVSDAVGCKSVEQIELKEPPPIVVNLQAIPVICFGQSDGVITTDVTGGTSGYTYLWNTGATAPSITGQPTGLYAVSVMDAVNCSQAAQVSVTQPEALNITISSTNVSCNGGSDGTLSIVADGGSIPYDYTFDGVGVNSFIDGVSSGVHNVSVTDINGCVSSQILTITEPQFAINLILVSLPASCLGESNGSATVSVSGGVTPYSYFWSNNAINQTNATATGLPTGNYSVSVTDANNCGVNNTGSVFVSEPSQQLSAAITPSAVLCFGELSGNAVAQGEGGTSPYTYLWSTGGNQQTEINLGVGGYYLTVSDANGCQYETNVSIQEPQPIVVSVTDTPVSCFGFANGAASVVASGGISPYQYIWSNNALQANNSNISAGPYLVTVLDVNSCQSIGSVTVSEPTQLTSTMSITGPQCHDGNDGQALSILSGGTPPYFWQWDINTAFQSGDQATNLSAGSYVVNSTDDNGCSLADTALVINPTEISLITTPNSDTICPGESISVEYCPAEEPEITSTHGVMDWRLYNRKMYLLMKISCI